MVKSSKAYIFEKFTAGAVMFALIFVLAGIQPAGATHDWALNFDGEDDYVDLGNDPSLDLSGDWEVTININDDDANYITYVNRVDAGGAYNVFWYIGSEFGNSGKIEVGFGDGSNWGTLHSDISIKDGQWHEVTWKKTGNDHKIFIDGVDHTGDTNIPPSLGDVNPSTNVYIGGDVESDNYYTSGRVDELKIAVDGTVQGHWELNEGTGTAVSDSSGNGNSGTIFGAEWVSGPSTHESGGGGSSPTTSRAPIVQMDTELSGTYSGEVDIDYTAYDIESTIMGVFGFHDKDDPINIYYSDDFTKDIAQTTWHPLETGLENTGTYTLDTAELPDGPKYRIKIEAVDSDGDTSFAESDFFGIDNTGPTYDVELLTPRPIKERDTIELKIISSEELNGAPSVHIKQDLESEEGEAEVSGVGNEFTASYTLGRGTRVEVLISGEDLAGNTGEVITSGKNFSITQFGPAPPQIENLTDGGRTGESLLDIRGSSEAGTRVVLTLNGSETFTAEAGADGRFSLNDVELSADRQGENTLSFVAFNEQNEDSGEVVYKVILNSAPQVAVLTPLESSLTGNVDIEWDAFDLNGDELTYAVQFSNDGGASWGTLAQNLKEKTYTIDTTLLADESYILRILADDGFESGFGTTGELSVDNGLPNISLDIPPNFFTQESSPVFSGNASGATVNNVEFTLDGENWRDASPADGSFGGTNEDFEIVFTEELPDGAYNMLVRAEWQTQRFVHSAHLFNVDSTPPEPPVITSPPLGGVISSDADVDPDTEGIQAFLSGNAEPGTRIQLIVNGQTYNRFALAGDGSFTISGVDFVEYGVNTVSLTVFDSAGNSASVSGQIISDNLPETSILTPSARDYLSGSTLVSWQASDPDGDPLSYTLQYRRPGGNWINIVENITGTSYSWNLSSLASAEYQLRVMADDGLATNSDVINVFIDNTAPGGSFELVGEEVTNDPRPLFSGSSSDDFSGIEFVEYSFDGTNWFTALITNGYRTNSAGFSFSHRFALEDDNYNVEVRVTDRAGNVGRIGSDSVQVETIPPRVGSYTLSHGGLTLFPEGDEFRVPVGTELRFTISLESDTTSASLRVGESVTELIKNPATSLWEANMAPATLGVKDMFISASDFADNSIIERKIGAIEATENGRVFNRDGGSLEGARITVFTSEGRVWQAAEHGLNNPVHTDASGRYSLLLPSGRYYLTVERDGYNKIKTTEFNLLSPRFIANDFTMQPREGFRGFVEDIIEGVRIF